jgi:hypothetical protein
MDVSGKGTGKEKIEGEAPTHEEVQGKEKIVFVPV